MVFVSDLVLNLYKYKYPLLRASVLALDGFDTTLLFAPG